jgi:hypothetical protein
MGASPWAQRAANHLCYVALTAATAWALISASGAPAATVTVGSPLGASFIGTLNISPPAVLANTSLAEPGANVVSPVTGAVVRWRITGSFSGGPFRLQVLRPTMGGEYTNVATSDPQTPSGTSLQTFTSDVPIQAGDLIALASTNVSDGFGIAQPILGSTLSSWSPQLPEGSTSAPTGAFTGYEVGFDAEVQPAPGLNLLAPSSGPTMGGTSVTIAGHDFTEVTAVKFGSTPATSFTANSDTELTAVSPPSSIAGVVNVSITTVAGTTPATASDQFTYTVKASAPPPVSCVVPKLKGKKLKTAKRALLKAECKLGTIKGKKSKSAKVKTQSPKPGTVLAPGSKVNVKVS